MNPIELKLYHTEFRLLIKYLEIEALNVFVLKGLSLSIDVALAEWFNVYFMKRWISIQSLSNKNAHKVKFPLFVAMRLWTRFQHETIPAELQSVLAEIDKQLTNNGFKPQ